MSACRKTAFNPICDGRVPALFILPAVFLFFAVFTAAAQNEDMKWVRDGGGGGDVPYNAVEGGEESDGPVKRSRFPFLKKIYDKPFLPLENPDSFGIFL